MKKLILILVLFLIAGISYSQVDTSKYKPVRSGTDGKYGVIENKVNMYLGDSGKVRASLVNVINQPMAKEWYEIIDSISTTVDTVSRKLLALKDFISSSPFLLIMTCDSAFQYSSSSSFTSGRTGMLKVGETETWLILESSNSNIYYKKWSAFSGKAFIRIKVYIL